MVLRLMVYFSVIKMILIYFIFFTLELVNKDAK